MNIRLIAVCLVLHFPPDFPAFAPAAFGSEEERVQETGKRDGEAGDEAERKAAPGSPAEELSVSRLIETGESRSAPIRSDQSLHTQLFKIPAPRGLILDRYGNPLAQTRAAQYVALNLQGLKSSGSLDEGLAAIRETLDGTPELQGFSFSVADLTTHWKHRPQVPFPLSQPLTAKAAENLQLLSEASDLFRLETVYLREYPSGTAYGHIAGYTSPSMPFQHGPLEDPENLWPPSEGAYGLESAFDEQLRGEDGLASYLYRESGKLHDVELVEEPVPGTILVTTLNRPMQELAYATLEKHGRPGALVAVDSVTGDILAMASFPCFDPNLFVGGFNSADYASLEADPRNPMLPRATRGTYPPGSAFKPFVALAAMDRGVINGTYSQLDAPPSLEIDGRVFHNWNDEHEGMLDVRYALLRSSNTWFYQAGIETGGMQILQMARAYGFGKDPGLPIPAASGSLPVPKNVAARQAAANLSIGQGDILASPLQMCIAMAGLSIGTYVPAPRLIIQTQDPETNEVKTTHSPEKQSYTNSRLSDRKAVRDGMWGVVNHEAGTGKPAAHDLPQVYGKTGTSQWRSGGEELNLAWFAGYVGSDEPRIAFTALVQGKSGEELFGGKTAAPLIGDFVEAVYADQEKYNVRVTVKNPSNPFARPRSQPLSQPRSRAIPVPAPENTGRSARPLPRTAPVRRAAPVSPRAGQPTDRPLRQFIDRRR